MSHIRMSYVAHANESYHIFTSVMPPQSTTTYGCSVLQCVAACCSVLQCVAVCCRVLQCVAGCASLSLNHTDKWVMPHGRMSHVTHTNESCHTYEWAMSHIRMNSVAYTNESCHTYEWVRPHRWMSHVTHTNESCLTYEWVMSHIRISLVTHTNESCHTHTNESCHTHTNESCHTHTSVMPSRSTTICAALSSCHTYEWVMSHIWMSHVTHVPQWYPLRAVRRNHIWLHRTFLMSNIRMSHVTHMRSHVSHTPKSCHTYEWVLSHTYLCDALSKHNHMRRTLLMFSELHIRTHTHTHTDVHTHTHMYTHTHTCTHTNTHTFEFSMRTPPPTSHLPKHTHTCKTAYSPELFYLKNVQFLSISIYSLWQNIVSFIGLFCKRDL